MTLQPKKRHHSATLSALQEQATAVMDAVAAHCHAAELRQRGKSNQQIIDETRAYMHHVQARRMVKQMEVEDRQRYPHAYALIDFCDEMIGMCEDALAFNPVPRLTE